MTNIIVCDNDKQIQEYYESLIIDTAHENNIDVKIATCDSGEELLFKLADNPNMADILYLDILMGQMNGLDVAKKLRSLGCQSLIIYLTSSDEYVFKAFDMNPFYYIVKDEIPVKKFKEIFLKAADTVSHKANDYFLLTTGAASSKILLEKIKYFEVHNRMICVCTTEDSPEFYSTMDEIEQDLDGKGFVRIHRSYLVNCHYIQTLARTQVTLTDGTVLPVSSKYAPTVQAAFSDYLLRV